DAQVIVSSLAPPVTGPEPIHCLVALAGEHPPLAETAAVLAAVRDALADIDARGLGQPPLAYTDVAVRLGQLPVNVELARLFQVDLVKPATVTLGKPIVDEVLRGVELAHRLARSPAEDSYAAFRRAFVERYQEREVPLLEALDEEVGIGFGAHGADHSP